MGQKRGKEGGRERAGREKYESMALVSQGDAGLPLLNDPHHDSLGEHDAGYLIQKPGNAQHPVSMD